MTEQISYVNGIKLCSMFNSNLNSFCLSLYFRAGSIFENLSNNGISHLLEHILLRNLKNRFDNFYDLLAMHGIDLQGVTYKEFIRLTINGPYDKFDIATDILCCLFNEFCINVNEFNNEKKRIKAEIRENDERTSLDYYFNKLVWENTEAEKTVLGYCKVLDSISINKLNDFRKECLSKDNCIIYITGNVSPEDINRLKEKINMLDIQENQCKRINTVSVSNEFFHRKCVINVKNGYWNYIKIGFDINGSKYPNAVLDLLYSILFKGNKALIYNYLSEDNSIIYSYDSALEQYDNIGNMNFKFEVDKNRIDDAIMLVIKLLNDIKEGRFNFEANLKAEMYYTKMEIDRPDDLNWSLAYYNHILKTQQIDYTDDFYGRFNITKEQVIEAAKEIFQLKNMTIAIKGNKKKINIKNIEDVLKTLDIYY